MSLRIALIVGVSQYESHTKLGNLAAPVNDAQRVYDVLSEYGGFDMLYPLPLADGKVGNSGRVDAQTLRKELRKILNPQAGEEVELAVFYFSGHGVSHHGMASYLSATDEALAVPLSSLIELAENSAVKNLCIWLDCCHSGEVLKFKPSEKKSFCLVAASTADGEALAKNGQSLLTEILCKALTPNQDRPEIHVMEFVDYLEAHRKNLPQQVLFSRGDTPFILTQFNGEVVVKSRYSPDDKEHRPYRGLLAFTKEESEFFFGRDGMIQQLLDKLSASRFVPLLGASGSGKSSLVLAGLLPKLPENDWQVLVMRPTAQPLQNLRDTLVRGFPDTQVGTLASGADLQREVLRLVTAGKRLLLVIDQFEEVFTECRDDAARAAFFACLLEALDSDNPLHLVLTLRADFLGHCTEQAYSGLGQRLQHHALLLVAPTAGELREAITRPLALVGMRCEQALEDELVDQTLHAKGSLPLLQYVLEKLWQSARQERSRELTLAMYQQLGGQHGGGLRGVLNEKADAFYQQLEPQQQRLMEWLMVELTQVGDGQDDTRRTVTLQELHNRQPQYTAALDALLAQLVTHERLLTQDHDDHEQATITVAHEALIRDWQRLRGWLESTREIKSWRLRLEDSIAAWKNGVSGSLLREKRLAEAQQIIDRNPNSLLIGQDERAFITASQTEAQRRKQLWVGSLLAFIVVLLVGIVTTTWQWQEANKQANVALIGKLASQSVLAIKSSGKANGYSGQGLLLAIQAFLLDRNGIIATGNLKDAVYSTHIEKMIYSSRSSFATIAFSPDGKNIVTGGDDKVLRLWDVNSGEQIGGAWVGHEGGVNSVSFSPDGTKVISGGDDKALRLWDVKSGTQIGNSWVGHEGGINSVSFSPDGTKVVSGSDDTTLRIWDVKSGVSINKPCRGHESAITSLSINPDDKVVISASGDRTLRLWNINTGEPIGMPWVGHKDSVESVAFSPDGLKVISASFDGSLRLWDAQIGKSIGEPWIGHKDSVLSVAFSPDGHLVASGDFSGEIQLWNAATGEIADKAWIGHESAISSIAFSPDAQRIVTAGMDKKFSRMGGNIMCFWNIEAGKLVNKILSGHDSPVGSVAFNPNGHLVVSGGTDGAVISSDNTLRLWDVETGKIVGEPWLGHEGGINSVTFSSDGKTVLSSSTDNTLRLWDVETGKLISSPLHDHKGNIYKALFISNSSKIVSIGMYDIIFREIVANNIKSVIRKENAGIWDIIASPNGKTILAIGNALQLLDMETGSSIAEPWSIYENYDDQYTMAYSPDGKWLVSNKYNVLHLWSMKTKDFFGIEWRGHEANINSIAFSPDGKTVVSGSDDKTLRLWDIETGKSIGEPWHGHGDSVNAVAFSPNGKYVISGSYDKTLRLWDADPESWAKKACSIVNRNFSLAEWQRFIGDALPYEKTCPDLPAPGEEGWVEPYAGG